MCTLYAGSQDGITGRGQKLQWCYNYSTLCPIRISELHDPVDLQRQLECISPPVGRPTTCTVIRTYLVPASTSPAGFRRFDVRLVSSYRSEEGNKQAMHLASCRSLVILPTSWWPWQWCHNFHWMCNRWTDRDKRKKRLMYTVTALWFGWNPTTLLYVNGLIGFQEECFDDALNTCSLKQWKVYLIIPSVPSKRP